MTPQEIVKLVLQIVVGACTLLWSFATIRRRRAERLADIARQARRDRADIAWAERIVHQNIAEGKYTSPDEMLNDFHFQTIIRSNNLK